MIPRLALIVFLGACCLALALAVLHISTIMRPVLAALESR
jgi:hypothetical protein